MKKVMEVSNKQKNLEEPHHRYPCEIQIKLKQHCTETKQHNFYFL